MQTIYLLEFFFDLFLIKFIFLRIERIPSVFRFLAIQVDLGM